MSSSGTRSTAHVRRSSSSLTQSGTESLSPVDTPTINDVCVALGIEAALSSLRASQ